jgi:hypothetical protein
MSSEIARIRIEIVFSERLKDTVAKSVAAGERTSVQSIVDGLVGVYRKTLGNTPSFINPLKALDKKVKVSVTGEVL